MIDDFSDFNRQLIPRWTTFKTNSMISSKDDGRVIEEMFKSSYYKAVVDWEKNKSTGFAYDVVTFGKLANQEEEKTFRDCLTLLSNTLFCQRIETDKRERVNYLLSIEEIFGIIHSNRILLNSDQNNALLWLDQAYYYSLIGQEEQTEKCIDISLRLNNSNSFILRSAASFFNHKKEPDRALYILRKSDYFGLDPQITAADISIANANKLKLKLTKKPVLDISPNNAELFAVYSTIESSCGNKKNAKKLMRKALCYPNENIIAQKVSLEKQFGCFSINTPDDIPCEYEAKAKLSFYQGDYEVAENESYNWFLFQPSSIEAATFNSSLNLTYTKNYEKANSVLKLADRINANNPSIKNNLAFCLANMGKFDDARKQLNLVDHTVLNEYEKSLLSATEGFVLYKTGERKKGIELYKEAIEGFSFIHNPFCVSKATYILGTLEYEKDVDTGTRLITEAYSIAEKNNNDYLMRIIRKDNLVDL